MRETLGFPRAEIIKDVDAGSATVHVRVGAEYTPDSIMRTFLLLLGAVALASASQVTYDK